MRTNPKDAAAKSERRTRLDLLEPDFKKSVAEALAFGAMDKGYGVRNYTKAPIEVRTYIAAIHRHLDAYLDGEDCAPDSGVHHLGHAGAGLDILFAARKHGSLVDDRRISEVGLGVSGQDAAAGKIAESADDLFSECDGDCYLCGDTKCRRNP